VRQHGAIDPLRPQHINVVLLGELLRGVNASAGPNIIWLALWMKTSMRPHSAMIFSTAALAEASDWTSSSIGRMSVPASAESSAAFLALRPVTSRIDGVAGAAESLGGQAAKTAGSARDEDDLGHDGSPSFFARGEGVGWVTVR
jgi:hypothetical protein